MLLLRNPRHHLFACVSHPGLMIADIAHAAVLRVCSLKELMLSMWPVCSFSYSLHQYG